MKTHPDHHTHQKPAITCSRIMYYCRHAVQLTCASQCVWARTASFLYPGLLPGTGRCRWRSNGEPTSLQQWVQAPQTYQMYLRVAGGAPGGMARYPESPGVGGGIKAPLPLHLYCFLCNRTRLTFA